MTQHTNETLAAALKGLKYNSDAVSVADAIGPLERDAYLALRSAWRADYAELAANIRAAKLNRKGDSTGHWQSARQRMRWQACRMMVVRAAISELGRRHWAARKALAA